MVGSRMPNATVNGPQMLQCSCYAVLDTVWVRQRACLALARSQRASDPGRASATDRRSPSMQCWKLTPFSTSTRRISEERVGDARAGPSTETDIDCNVNGFLTD